MGCIDDLSERIAFQVAAGQVCRFAQADAPPIADPEQLGTNPVIAGQELPVHESIADRETREEKLLVSRRRFFLRMYIHISCDANIRMWENFDMDHMA